MLRGFENDLKTYLLDNYPLIPLGAKQNAENTLGSINLFQPEDHERKWVFDLPLTVQKSFVMFFMKKKLEGETVFGIEELNDKNVSLTDRIVTFCNLVASLEASVSKEDDTLSSTITEAPSKRTRVIEEEEEEEKKGSSGQEDKLKKSLLIVLTGLPGSGKTTLCEKLIDNMKGTIIKRLCQDDIGKDACERESHMLLSDGGKIVIIDRTNINVDQRKIWVQIAKRYKSPTISITLNIDKNICITRAKSRKNHTLKEKDVPAVVGRLSKQYKPVTLNEGFDQIINCENDTEEFYKSILDVIRSYGF